MPRFLLKRWHGLHVIWMFILLAAVIVTMYFYIPIFAVVGFMVMLALIYYTWTAEKTFRKDLNEYISTLSYRIHQSSEKVMQELPIGILLFNEEKVVEWHNPFVAKMFKRESLIGESVLELIPQLKNKKEKEIRCEMKLERNTFQVLLKVEERVLFIQEITAQADLLKRYQEEKSAFGLVMLDNLDEATQGMEDQTRNMMLSKVTGVISDWAQKYHILLRRVSSDRFLMFMDQRSLHQLEQTRFEILDEIRDMTSELKVPFTLSIGIASGVEDFIELGQMANSSLDMALGRGGDQVAVKVGQRMTFYGGRSNALEKRTRVRARVISHALRDLIRESDNVIIMGHKVPDMDAIGAAIGVLKAVQVSQKEGYIVLEGINPSIQKLMDEIYDQDKLSPWFITPEYALQLTTQRTLVVVVDTHKASLVAEARLLQQSSRIVVVDHHRRGEEFINDAVLVYMEPYASSTCELVTELLQYFNERLSMDVLESTALLAGITMDTKSFSLRTGARTFEAASYLRRNGADTAMIQRLLKEDLDSYVRKAEIIKHAEIIYDHIAVAVTEPNRKHSQLLIAQVADTLLNMTDIMASFVISERMDGLIGISARSLGEINVQLVMERLGGGGHLTNAATQMEGTLQEAAEQLKHVLEEMKAEEGLFE